MKTLTDLTVDLWVQAQIFAQSGGLDQVLNAEPSAPESIVKPIVKIVSFFKFGGLAVCLVGVITAGAAMAAGARHGEGSRKVDYVIWAAVGAIVVGASGIIIGFILELTGS